MFVVKLLFNSTVSTKEARFITADISNFYLNTPLKRLKYIRLKLSNIPDKIIDQYGLHTKVTPEGFIYMEVNKSMSGLLQSGLLANELPQKRLNKHVYHQTDSRTQLKLRGSLAAEYSLSIVHHVARDASSWVVESGKSS